MKNKLVFHYELSFTPNMSLFVAVIFVLPTFVPKEFSQSFIREMLQNFPAQGCLMVYFQAKNAIFGIFSKALGWKILV
jgi:hypothetical protein